MPKLPPPDNSQIFRGLIIFTTSESPIFNDLLRSHHNQYYDGYNSQNGYYDRSSHVFHQDINSQKNTQAAIRAAPVTVSRIPSYSVRFCHIRTATCQSNRLVPSQKQSCYY